MFRKNCALKIVGSKWFLYIDLIKVDKYGSGSPVVEEKIYKVQINIKDIKTMGIDIGIDI